MKLEAINLRLWIVLQWITLALIAKVLVSIVANYVDYFPPNFESLFLSGRKPHFQGAYQIAFFAHILSTPVTLPLALFLLSHRFRGRFPRFHRWAGRFQVALILLFVAPSGLVMASHSIGGPISNVGFAALSVATATCAAIGWRSAMKRRFASHRRWMIRCAILLFSAVTLRVIGGITTVFDLEPYASYRFASWGSWLIPLACFELYESFRALPLSRSASS